MSLKKDILVIPLAIKSTIAPRKREEIIANAQVKYDAQFPENNVLIAPYTIGTEFYYPIIIINNFK